MFIGCIIGTRFALKYQKNKKNLILLGILIAIFGAFLAAISFGIVDWMIISFYGFGGISLLFAIFIPYTLMAIIIGVIIGIVVGIYYFINNQKPVRKPLINDEFYESLK